MTQTMTREDALGYVALHTDDDVLDIEDLQAAFTALHNCEPTEDDEQLGLWSLICLAADLFEVGDTVEAGETEEDHDTGTVTEIDGDNVTVSWTSGVRTTQSASLLRRAYNA